VAEAGKKLTFFEAAAIVTGYGIGGGVMAVPYLASRTGMSSVLIMLAAAYCLSLLLHFMVAEAMLRDGQSAQMVELFDKYLFRGRFGRPLMWTIFTLIVLAFIASLSAYIAGGGRIIAELLGVPLWAGFCINYAVAAGVAFFGLKVVGVSEKYAVMAMFVLMFAVALTALLRPFAIPFSFSGGASVLMALFGMIMFSFFSLFSVPQVVDGLKWNKRLIPGAIATGLGMNGMMTLVMAAICLGASKEVTPIAIIGLGKALGGWVDIGGSIFILLAMLMPYWSISFALAVVVQERVGWDQRLCWLLATLPTFAIVVTGVSDFLGFIRIAGGAIAVLVSVMLVPLLNSVRKFGPVKEPAWKMGFWGTWPFQLLVLAGYVMMAAGSLMAVK
jgi:amino acid permease